MSARVLDSGLRSGLDYAVFLHVTFLMEQWQRWRARATVFAEPEPEVSEEALLRALAARDVTRDDGRPLALSDVRGSLLHVAAAGLVRGLSVQGGGQ
ncbi:hypothetical protein [Streptomyces sp. NPDC006668]|uniref:hypothetical protein n=1 Tax=Streptomyces sp. NPDC006668 TaxID=3156903 RepID=UPI0033ECDF26